jgi:hypothetical protein
MTRSFRSSALLLAALAAPLAAAPEKWASTIDAFTKADAAHPPAKDGVVFVGSSTIVKWTTLEKDFPGLPIIKRGFGGSELSDSVFYAARIVTAYAPRTVVVYAGENDLQLGKTAEEVHGYFRAFVAKVHAALPHTRIVFIGMKPSPSRAKIHDKVKAANALIAADCAKDDRLRFVEVWNAMLDAKGGLRPDIFVADQLHLNPAGYAILAPLVAAQLR